MVRFMHGALEDQMLSARRMLRPEVEVVVALQDKIECNIHIHSQCQLAEADYNARGTNKRPER